MPVGRSGRRGLLILLSLAVATITACTLRIEFASPRAVPGDLAATSSGLAGHEQRLFEMPGEAEPPPEAGIEVASLPPPGGVLQLWPLVRERRQKEAGRGGHPDAADPLRPQVGDLPAASAPAHAERSPSWSGAAAPALAVLPQRAARGAAVAALVPAPIIPPAPPRPPGLEPPASPTVLAVLPPPPKPAWLLALDETARRAGSGGADRRRSDPQLVLAPGLELALPEQRYDLAWLSAISGRLDLIEPAAGPLFRPVPRREPAAARGSPIRLFPSAADRGL